MNMTQWINRCLSSTNRLAIPIMTHPGIELINKTIGATLCDGRVHAQAVISLHDKFPSDGCTTIMDLTLEAEAFGASTQILTHAMPKISTRLVSNTSEIQSLTIPSLQAGRIPQFLLANKLVARTICNKPIFACCIGPFSLACWLYHMSELKKLTQTEPEAAHLLIQKCTLYITKYILALKETGIDGIFIAEPTAGLLSNNEALEFSSRYIRQIIQKVEETNFVVIFHNCGNTGDTTQAMIDTGARILHFGNTINMRDVLQSLPPHILAMGNLDPVGVFKEATPEAVKEATANLLAETHPFSNFILSSGCDIPAQTPLININSFFSEVAYYNRHKFNQ